MRFDRLLPGLMLAVLALLNGCGGGGGGAAGPDAPLPVPTPAPPVELVSGLLPEAGPVGATLYADAAPLRVLRDGTEWTYRGVDQPRGADSAEGETTTYVNTVKYTSNANGMSEVGNNLFNDGPDDTGLYLEGGAYKYRGTIGLAENAPQVPVEVVELRSPVRVGDQYVNLDKHIANAGVDLDGDKVNDAFDVALYGRVVGEETLDLRTRPQVKAVRVDTTLRLRAIYSKTGAKSAVFGMTQSYWYAPGLGVVKRRLVAPSSIPGALDRMVTETLQNWDGGTEGLGQTEVAPALPPASALVGSMLQYPIDAVGLDTHAVVATLLPAWHASSGGLALSQLDAGGKVLAVRAWARDELFPGAQSMQGARLLRIGDEVRLLARTSKGVVSMVALDPTGQRILRPAITVLTDPEFGDYFQVATDGARIGLGWLSAVPDDRGIERTGALAQLFDATGQALGPAGVLLSAQNVSIDNFSMAVSDTRMAVSWQQTGAQWGRRLAVIDGGSGALLAQTALPSNSDDCTRVEAVSLQPGIAIACWNQPRSTVGAARIDAGGKLVLSAGATLVSDTLKLDWRGRVEGGVLFGGRAGQLLVSAWQQGKYLPEDARDSGFTSVYQTSATGSPLAASAPVLLANVFDGPVRTVTTIRLGKRLLLVGADSSGYLRNTSVWLPE